MPIKWNCLEPLTAIGIGIGACALAPLDMGLAAGAVIGGSGLLARIKENSRKAGLEDDKLIARMQKQLLGKLDHWDSHAERTAAERADEAMNRLLPQVMLTREQLAATATKSGESAERYPVLAARLVVAELAHHDAMFAEPAAGAPASAERLFALEAVESALRAAKDDPDYATLLTLDIAIELGRALKETIDNIKELASKVDAGFAAVMAELARQRGRGKSSEMARLSEQALRGAVARFVTFSPQAGPSEVVEAVEAFAVSYQALQQKVAALEAHDNHLLGLKQAAEQALDDGDLDRARNLLGEAAQLRENAALDQVRAAAQARAAQAAADLTALQWETAATNWERAVVMLQPFASEEAAGILYAAGVELYNFDLNHARGAIAKACDFYRAALTVYTREALPIAWAGAQNNLGNALRVQGERSGGAAGMALLAEAVDALRAALTVRTREALPAQWAMTQNNLGNSFQVQGARSGGAAGVALLADAVEAYRAALTVFTREALPDQWAVTQNNLGTALKVQGERSGEEDRDGLLAEAVAAYRAALTVRTREALPAYWATSQNNLGNALLLQGQRSGGEAGVTLLAEAVEAYRAALTVLTRESLPAQWATTQNNLGATLKVQGERSDGEAGVALLAEAVEACRAALTVRTCEAMAADWALTQSNLGNALRVQGERSGGDAGVALLMEAVEAYHAALTVRTREAMPTQWAGTQRNIAVAELTIGNMSAGEEQVAHWRLAEEAVQLALEVYDPENMPYDHGTATELLARIRDKLAGEE